MVEAQDEERLLSGVSDYALIYQNNTIVKFPILCRVQMRALNASPCAVSRLHHGIVNQQIRNMQLNWYKRI